MRVIGRSAVVLVVALAVAAIPSGVHLSHATPALAAVCYTVTDSPSSPSPTGTSVLITGSNPAGCFQIPRWRFWLRPPGGSWRVVQDFSASNTFNWTTTGLAGTYGIEVDFLDVYAPTNYYGTPVVISHTLQACSAAALTANPASPQVPSVIQLTATATCPGTPTYRFWERAPGGAWHVVQDYSTTATYSWDATGQAPGTFNLEVDVRNQGATAAYEAVGGLSYMILPPTVPPTACTSAGLAASPTSPQATGASVTFTGSATGCMTPVYRFWTSPPGGAWSIARDYSITNTFTWASPATGMSGTYRLEVDVRGQGESASYDAHANSTYSLNACTAASLGANPTSPHYPSGNIVLTGTATCPGTPTYRFWVRAPSAGWAIAQDFSTTNTFSWNTNGLKVGSYGLEVDVRNQGATSAYERVSNLVYMLTATPCATAGLTANPPSPGPTGSSIVFTATSSGCTTPVYRFWASGRPGLWDIEQDYSTSNTWTMVPPISGQPATFKIEVDVRDQAETTSYDVVNTIPYQLVGCTAAGLSAAPPSPQVHGTSVMLTATATCPGTAVYQFWERPQFGTWVPITNPTTTNTFTANPNSTGTWQFQVTVGDQNAVPQTEAYAQITYVFT